MKALVNEIFQKSISYEYFWRALITFMIDSNNCEYWTDMNNKQKFISAIKSQMLDGDCFELIDGRTLEMRGSILRDIVGDIANKKCIVATVIGP